MRDDSWLFQQLDDVWEEFFPDMPQDNDVRIIWGRKAKRRLGSIKQGEKRPGRQPETIITINSLFKDPKIPDFVIKATIAHELAHYFHGFHSPLERKFEKPHEGGVVHKELEARGAKALEKKSKLWLKENWRNYLEQKMPQRKIVAKRKQKIIVRWF